MSLRKPLLSSHFHIIKFTYSTRYTFQCFIVNFMVVKHSSQYADILLLPESPLCASLYSSLAGGSFISLTVKECPPSFFPFSGIALSTHYI